MMQEEVDTVTARVIALLPPTSRKRLDDKLHSRRTWPNDAMSPYRAGSGELDGVKLEIDSKRGKLTSRVWISGKARWERHALHLTMEVPDTIVAAMRRKPLDSIVSHPLLAGLKVTSARREGKDIVIETGRLPLTGVAGIESTGTDRPVDLMETLEALGVTEVCRVAAELVERVPGSLRHLLAARLADARTSVLGDIIGWRPTGAKAITVYVKDGILQATVQFNVGHFAGGTLGLYGSQRTNGRLLSGSFARFRLYPTNNYRQRLKQPTITIGEFAGMMRPKLAKAA